MDLINAIGTVVIVPTVFIILHHVTALRKEVSSHEERLSNVERRITPSNAHR